MTRILVCKKCGKEVKVNRYKRDGADYLCADCRKKK